MSCLTRIADLGTTYVAMRSYDVSNSLRLALGTTTHIVVMYSLSTTISWSMRSARPRTMRLPCCLRSMPCSEPRRTLSSATFCFSSSSSVEMRSEMLSDSSRSGVFSWNLASSHSNCCVVNWATGTARREAEDAGGGVR